MKICFIGDDLYQNTEQIEKQVLIRCDVESYEVDSLTSKEVNQLLLQKKAEKKWSVLTCKESYNFEEYPDGIYWANYNLDKIERLHTDGIVARTYEEAICELTSSDSKEFDFYVVDLTFLGSREVAQEKLGYSPGKYQMDHIKVLAPFGVLIAKILLEKGLPFVIFTTDIGHAREGLALLVKEGICSQQEVYDISSQCERIGWERWTEKPRLLISTDKRLAVGPKLYKQTWDMLLGWLMGG